MNQKEVMTALRNLKCSKKNRGLIIRFLEMNILAVGEKVQSGSLSEAVDFICKKDGSLDTDDRWGQFRLFPLYFSEHSPLYFGYKVNENEFIWGFGYGRG